MKYNIFVDGNQGTTGLRIFERLNARDDINIIKIDEDKRKDTNERLKCIKQADISFLCLPDAASKEIVLLADENDRIIDTSTAHRTLDTWAYGFCELGIEQREKIKNSNRVAVPGCHASGFVSIAYPLVKLGIANSDYPFTCHSVTGYSGGGKNMIAAYESDERPSSYKAPRQYGVTLCHKHLPEMTKICGLKNSPVFNPIVSDFYSGMVVSVPLHNNLLNVKNPEEIAKMLKDFYKGNPLITVHDFNTMTEDGFISGNELSGKDNLEIFVYGHENQTLIISRFDNLGKGASGAAVQCMNVMLGLDETKGLVY
ncbi:MAG: N-acetyl-gamma-glutamyl-phosphate reductase [Ruminococcaceae bacterium]|nr:N-acetyl-gamma-glutamyl-phosphate reductase [Oscillospiraceae bacterium]